MGVLEYDPDPRSPPPKKSDKPFSSGSIRKLTGNLGNAAESGFGGLGAVDPVFACEHFRRGTFPFHSLLKRVNLPDWHRCETVLWGTRLWHPAPFNHGGPNRWPRSRLNRVDQT